MMNSLNDLLKNHAAASPIIKGVRAAQIIEAAEKIMLEIFGSEMSEFAKPAYFKNQTLTIACLSSAAAQEIKLNENTLLQAINKAAPYAKARKIRYLS